MSRTQILSKHTGYSGPFVNYEPRVIDGLLCWHFPRINGAEAIKNYPRGTSGSVVGTPKFTSSYMETRREANLMHLIESTAYEADSMTLLTVCQPNDSITNNASTPLAGGNFRNLQSGIFLGYRPADQLEDTPYFSVQRVLDDEGGPINSQRVRVAAGYENWNFYAALLPDSEGMTLFNKTEGLESTGFQSGIPPKKGDNPLTIGGLADGYHGSCRVAFFAAYDRILSTDEIDICYDQVRRHLSSYSSPIEV